MDRETARTIIIIIVGAGWFTSVIADIVLLSRYHPSPYMHMIMGAVVTALVGKQMLEKNGQDNK